MDINFSKLNNDKLYALDIRVYDILSPVPVAEMGIKVYFDEYIVEHEKYKKAMLKVKEAQKVLEKKDNKRDKDGTNLRNHVKTYTNHPDEEVATMAQELLDELDRHGPQFYNKSYKEQTAILEYIFNAIDTRFAEFITRINADEWYDFLKTSQADFEKTRKLLIEKNAEEIDEESPSKIRPELIKSLRNLFIFMPMQYKANQNAELGKVIKQIEAELKRF